MNVFSLKLNIKKGKAASLNPTEWFYANDELTERRRREG